MPRVGNGSFRSVNPDVTTQHQQPKTKLPETDYQKFYGRMVFILKKVISSARSLSQVKPAARNTFRAHHTLKQASVSQYNDDYHRALHDYKIAATMQLHHLANIDEREIAGRPEVVIGAGRDYCGTEQLKKVTDSLTLSAPNLCYQFLAEGREPPTNFLQRALLPYFEDYLTEHYHLDQAEAGSALQKLALETGLHKTRDITFERVLELKNRIRWQLGPSVEEVSEPCPESPPPETAQFNYQHPALTPPSLKAPGTVRYYLDKDDKAFVQQVVDQGGFLKIPRHDLLNRLKRKILRNKTALGLNGLGIALSTAITTIISGPAGAALNLFVFLGWLGVSKGVIKIIRLVRVMHKVQAMQTSADFALNPTDMEALKGLDEEKFRSFMKCCRYVCSHETLAGIYNCYAELEKDVETSEELSKAPLDSVAAAIRFEESKARFRLRKKNLDISFELFNRLFTGAVGDLRRMEEEWHRDIQGVWENKFRTMPAKERARLFRRAAHDPKIAGKYYHFQTDNTEWLKSIFPQMAAPEEWSEIEQDRVQQRVEEIFGEMSGPKKLNSRDKRKFNSYSNQVVNAMHLVKKGVTGYILGWGKAALRSTVAHGFKVGWHGVRRAPHLELAPQLPKISVDGLLIFVFFFIADLCASSARSRLNHYRLKQIQSGQKGKTGIMLRERTGREEIATLRQLTKQKLGSFIDTLFSLHDAHKALMEELDYHKHLNEVDPYSPPYSHMDDYEAALLILRRKYYEQIIAGMMTGAIGEFHRQVQSKSSNLSDRMIDVIARS